MKFSSARKSSLQRAMKAWRASGHFHIKSLGSTLWQNMFKTKRSVALSTVQKYTDCQPQANYLISLTTSKFGNSGCFFCFSCSQFVDVGMWKTGFTYLAWNNERPQILTWNKNLNLSFSPLEQSLWLQEDATLYTIFNFIRNTPKDLWSIQLKQNKIQQDSLSIFIQTLLIFSWYKWLCLAQDWGVFYTIRRNSLPSRASVNYTSSSQITVVFHYPHMEL